MKKRDPGNRLEVHRRWETGKWEDSMEGQSLEKGQNLLQYCINFQNRKCTNMLISNPDLTLFDAEM